MLTIRWSWPAQHTTQHNKTPPEGQSNLIRPIIKLPLRQLGFTNRPNHLMPLSKSLPPQNDFDPSVEYFWIPIRWLTFSSGLLLTTKGTPHAANFKFHNDFFVCFSKVLQICLASQLLIKNGYDVIIIPTTMKTSHSVGDKIMLLL